jgi:hypothetical protein
VLAQAAGIAEDAPRKAWPREVLRKVVSELARTAPRQLLARELFAGAAGPGAWWGRQQAYARCAAVTSLARTLSRAFSLSVTPASCTSVAVSVCMHGSRQVWLAALGSKRMLHLAAALASCSMIKSHAPKTQGHTDRLWRTRVVDVSDSPPVLPEVT